MQLFRLLDDMTVVDRWHLGDHTFVGSAPRSMQAGEPLLAEAELSVPVTQPGRPLAYSETAFGLPIACLPLARAISAVSPSDVQFVRLQVRGLRLSSDYAVLNCLQIVECLDEGRSQFIKWGEEDGRPDRLGQYRAVTRLAIAREKVPGNVHFFRIKGWSIALVVSDVVREAMEVAGCEGAVFEQID